MTDRIIQIIGWAGALAVLLAYALTSVFGFAVNGPTALVLNMGGGAAIALASWQRRAYQSVFVNVIWFLIGFVTLAKVIF